MTGWDIMALTLLGLRMRTKAGREQGQDALSMTAVAAMFYDKRRR